MTNVDVPAQYGRCETCGLSLLLGRLMVYVVHGFRILRFPGCGLMWTDVASGFNPTTIYTDKYFQGGLSDGYYDYVGSQGLLRTEYARRVALIRAYKSGGSLLEIGCATGGFLLEAQRYFSVQGIDISAYAVQVAHDKGLDVDCGLFETSAAVRPPYDMVAMFDTIEHLQRPAQALERIHSILAVDGYIVISTGDAKSLLARCCGSHWRLLTPPQHLWFFNHDNIALLLSRLGFRVVKMHYAWRRVPLSLIWYQLFRGRARLLPSLLANLVLPLNLYDTMTVVGSKVN